jgi:hypothetical protein
MHLSFIHITNLGVNLYTLLEFVGGSDQLSLLVSFLDLLVVAELEFNPMNTILLNLLKESFATHYTYKISNSHKK